MDVDINTDVANSGTRRKVSTTDLKLGQYVCELDRPWRETPFLFQGFEIRTEDELRMLQQFCRHVYVIDRASRYGTGQEASSRATQRPAEAKRLTELEFEQALLKLNNHPAALGAYEEEVSLDEELPRAQRVHAEAASLAEDVLGDAKFGRKLDGKAVRRMTLAMADSVLRNPDALSCYAQIKNKDRYLLLHSLRCCILAMVFGRHLGLPREEIGVLGAAGLLHDIGMVKVPDELLRKPERYTPFEAATVRQHVRWGVEILEQAADIPPLVIEAARGHHENFDGTGYLRCARGREIGLVGLMMAIIDYYDAVTSDRPHKQAVSPYAALRLMYQGRGTLFDPELTERFIQCLGIYPVGSVVELDTGEVGVVVGLNRKSRLKPRLTLISRPDKTPYMPPPMVNLLTRRLPDGSPCGIERVLEPGAVKVDPVQYLPIAAVA